MRTTLDIENDVLAAVKELARQQNVTVGKIISQLVRDALTGRSDTVQNGPVVAGFRPFLASGTIVTNEMMDALRDEEGV